MDGIFEVTVTSASIDGASRTRAGGAVRLAASLTLPSQLFLSLDAARGRRHIRRGRPIRYSFHEADAKRRLSRQLLSPFQV